MCVLAKGFDDAEKRCMGNRKFSFSFFLAFLGQNYVPPSFLQAVKWKLRLFPLETRMCMIFARFLLEVVLVMSDYLPCVGVCW